MEITLKQAEPQDIEDLLPLVAAFHAEEGVDQAPETRRAAVAALLANTSYGEIWRIESPGSLSGYLAFAFGYSIEFNGRDAFLDEIYVAPTHRGLGLGRAALKEMKANLQRRGVKAVHLEVEVNNSKAEKLYASEGFQMRRSYHLMSARLD